MNGRLDAAAHCVARVAHVAVGVVVVVAALFGCHVAREGTRVREALATAVAVEWFLARVDARVLLISELLLFD